MQEAVEFLHARAQAGSLEFGEYYGSLLKRFCQENDKKRLWIMITAGEAQNAEARALFHGPVLDAFVRATGDTDRRKHKGMLKKALLCAPDGSGGVIIRKTRNLTEGEYARFIDGCVEILMDQFGGYLMPREEKQYRRYRCQKCW